MQSSQRWPRWSTGMLICTRLFPRHGDSLFHVARLIDEYVIESFDERVLPDACAFGASSSDLDFLLSRTVPDWRMVVPAAVRGGHMHVLQWMTERRDRRGPWKADFYSAIEVAGRYDHLKVIKWLHERGFSGIGRSEISDTAGHGHLAVLKWLYKHATGGVTSGMKQGMDNAAGRGHLATVQWIYENFKDVVNVASAMTNAARNGDLDMLQWLHQQRSCSEACSTKTMDAAVSGGHFRLVEWLHENCSRGCSRYAAENAADTGNLPMLQWLHKYYNDRFGSYVMNLAASEGHLEITKWLHEHRTEGCTKYAMDVAAVNGHLDVVRWLHANRTEGCTTDAMDGAARKGHLDVLKWLHENRSEGCTDTASYEATRNGHADVLRWLVEHYPDKCEGGLMEVAAWEGHLDLVRFFSENTNQRAARWGLEAAASQGWLKTLLVLMQKYPNPEVGAGSGSRLSAIGKAFEKLLSQISYQNATRASLLWREALESLDLFHSSGLYECVSLMLNRALRRGYAALARRFIGQRNVNEKCKYVALAATSWNIILLRWLLENGTPIDKPSAIQLATEREFSEYVEVAGYLSEGDRVQLVCEAVTKPTWRKLLQWTLENTTFMDDSSRSTIYNAIQQAPSDTEQWLRETLANAAVLKWEVSKGYPDALHGNVLLSPLS